MIPADRLSPCRDISPDDAMFQGNTPHYFDVGASAYEVMRAAVILAGLKPKSILDYGAGAGRVTRWLKVGISEASIDACDVRPHDMAFLSEKLGVKAWPIDADIEKLNFSSTYDLIWVGSVITHLPADRTRRLIEILLSATNPGGLVVLSFHGWDAINSGRTYLDNDPEGWKRILTDFSKRGYGYADYRGTPGYGISVNKPNWMVDLVHSIKGAQLVLLSERAWGDHHDVVAIRATR